MLQVLQRGWARIRSFVRSNKVYIGILFVMLTLGGAWYFFSLHKTESLRDLRIQAAMEARLQWALRQSAKSDNIPPAPINILDDAELNEKPFWDEFWEINSEIALFLMSASIVHLFYFWRVRTEDEHSLRQLSDDFKKAARVEISNIVEGTLHHGLYRVHNTFNYSDVFRSLNRGDKVFWLDTLYPNLDDDSIRLALRNGADFSVLVMDLGSKSTRWRSRELKNKAYPEDRFKLALETFLGTMQALKDYSATTPGVFEFRTYRDLLGLPICIAKRAGRSEVAYTGFYLREPSDNFIHLEWRQGLGDEPNHNMVAKLEEYFNEKWITWSKPDLPLVDGRWKYQISNLPVDKTFSAEGEATISQAGRGRDLSISGKRLKKNGRLMDYPVGWGNYADCLFSQICSKEKDVIRFDYVYNIGSGREMKGFCRIKIVKYDNDIDLYATQMEGEFFYVSAAASLAGSEVNGAGGPAVAETVLPEDAFLPRCGKITFSREARPTPESARPEVTVFKGKPAASNRVGGNARRNAAETSL